MGKTILVIDDDKDLCVLIEKCIVQEGGIPLIANSIQEAMPMLELYYKDIKLVILDIMLPDGNGLDLLTKINSTYSIATIMVTAKDGIDDKVIGLRLGAVDYLSKPFSIKELGARISVQMRHYYSRQSKENTFEPVLEYKGLKIHFDSRTAYCYDTEMDLTSREFELLYHLALNQGKVFTKKQLYEALWKEVYLHDDNSLLSIICKLRKKLNILAPNINYIETIRGIGYRFNREV